MAKSSRSSTRLSYDTKTLVVVITLIFVYPIGILLMYLWMKWNGWLKFIITLPFYLILFGIILILSIGFSVKSKSSSIEDRILCEKSCEMFTDKNKCTQTCLNRLQFIVSPTPTD